MIKGEIKMEKIVTKKNKEALNDYIKRLMNESTPDLPIWNIENIKHGKSPAWNYIDGCMMTSLLNLYYLTNDRKYLDFVEHFVDYYVFEDGSIRGYKLETFNLDNINEGRVLFALYDNFKKEKYLKAIKLLYSQLENQPRTKEGNFFHKAIYENQIWLDGLYMAQPFYVMYANRFNKELIKNDIVKQFKNVFDIMYDKEKHLYYHGYDASKSIFWANPKTGLSSSFWLRAIGWYTTSLIDCYDLIEDKENKAVLKEIFIKTIDGILEYKDKEKNMFYQVVDKKDVEGNYLESSGSAMISYSILKGARLHVLDEKYRQIGLQIFESICDTYLTINDGVLNLGGICLSAGLGPDKNRKRDGSVSYYLSEPVVQNDAKGVGPLVMAFIEVLQAE